MSWSSPNRYCCPSPAKGSLQRVLVNAANQIKPGPMAVCAGLLPSLVSAAPHVEFTLMLPESFQSRKLDLPANARVCFRPTKRGVRNNIQRMQELFFEIRRAAVQSHVDVCLTLGDYPPVGLPCPSVVFVHLPVLAYSRCEIPGPSDWPWPQILYLKSHFRMTAPHTSFLLVQTEVMAKRLSAAYGIAPEKIGLIPQPVPRHVIETRGVTAPSPIRSDSKAVKLTFLAAYYPHKNHEILPLVAAELRRRGLSNTVQIYTTVDAERCPSEKVRQCFARDTDVITNLGLIGPADVASLLRDSSALFSPTLIESYGLTYLEAFSLGLPILTSDRDFAHHMCGSLAHYFDPCDASSIVDCIERFCARERQPDYAARAQQELDRFPRDWDVVGRMFLDFLQRAAAQNRTRDCVPM